MRQVEFWRRRAGAATRYGEEDFGVSDQVYAWLPYAQVQAAQRAAAEWCLLHAVRARRR